MSTSVTKACGAGADGGGGDQPWTDYANITADDLNTATCSLGAGEDSNLLVADNFGFAMPSGATLEGIVVVVKKYVMGDAEDVSIRVRGFGGVVAGDNKANIGMAWPGSEGSSGYGDVSDAWSAGFDDVDVNSSGFGVQLQATSATGGTLRVQYVEITIYYSGGDTHQPQIVGNPQHQTRQSVVSPTSLTIYEAFSPIVVAPSPWQPELINVRVSAPKARSTAQLTLLEAPSLEIPDSTPGWAPELVFARVTSRSMASQPTLAIFTPPAGFDELCSCPGSAAVLSHGFASARIVNASDDPYVPDGVRDLATRGPLVTTLSYSAIVLGRGSFASALVLDHCHCE